VSVLAGRGPWSAAPRRAAGTRPERFHAASSVPVIRVAPRHHRRICAPDICRPGHPSSPRRRAVRGHVRWTRSRRAEAGPGRAVPARLRQAAPTPASRAPGVCRPGHPYSPRQRAERGHERRTRSRRAEAGPGRAVPARLGRRPSRRFQTAALPPTSNGWRSR
jgi:hypothetical protein